MFLLFALMLRIYYYYYTVLHAASHAFLFRLRNAILTFKYFRVEIQ